MTTKQMFKEEMEQKRFEIQVRTLTNGFMLEVNNEGYMYYDAISLIEGICIHVGLERFEAMTKKKLIRALKRENKELKMEFKIEE